MDSPLLKNNTQKLFFFPTMNGFIYGSTPYFTQNQGPLQKNPVSRLKDFILNIVCLSIKNYLEQNIKSDPVSPLPSVEVV